MRPSPVGTYYAALSAGNAVLLTFCCAELNAPVINPAVQRTKHVMSKANFPKKMVLANKKAGQGPFPGPSTH